MPAGPGTVYEERALPQDYRTQNEPQVNGDESAASILQSVKEQEAQFEQLTRELEAERQSVANQLERCKLGSETASMSSISSTDESFHWRQPAPQEAPLQQQQQHQQHLEEESDGESKMSGSQLVDSCLRVLQERGLMNVGEDPLEYMHDENGAPPPRPPPSNEHYSSMTTYTTSRQTMNGPTSPYTRSQLDSPNPSLQSAGSRNSNPQTKQVTVTKVVTTRQVQQRIASTGSPGPTDNYADYPSMNLGYHGSASQLTPSSPGRQPHSPASSQGRGTPTRFNPRDLEPLYSEAHYPRPDGGPDRDRDVSDSFDHQYFYEPQYRPAEPQYQAGPPYQVGPQYEEGPQYQAGQPFPYRGHQQHPSFDRDYERYPGAGGDRLNDSGPQTYGGSQYGRPYDDLSSMDRYRSTPPIDDTHRRLPNGSYNNLTPAERDRYRNTPPIDGADPYRDIPAMDDDRFDPNRPPSERGDAYQDPMDQRFNIPPRDDDPYQDARPLEGDRYGRPLLDDARTQRTPSPAGGSDRMELPRFPFPREGFGYQGGLGYPDNEPPYGSRSHMPYGQDGPHNMYDDDEMGPHSLYENTGPRDMYEESKPAFNRDFDEEQPDPSMNAALQHYPYDGQGPRNMYDGEEDGQPRAMYDDDGLPYNHRGDFEEEGLRGDPGGVDAPPLGYDPNRRSPSIDSETRDHRWRNPDLPEVIDFLSHSSNAIKANAAAYLQHLCYMDDGVKAKTRGLGGIPALVDLVNNEIPEVHRSACGALRNLSYGRANDENKRAIKNAGGIPALVRLLRKSPDNDVRELVTGILWNLSSCQDLKKPIIDDGLTVIVNNVIIPHSGWDRNLDEEALKQPHDIYWSTVFRNASGILRNISSDGEYARKKLRECEGLVDAILYIVKGAIGKNDIDNKSVENCVCILRNLSYACQEVEDPTYLKRRTQPKQQPTKAESTGCFGGNKKKKDPQKIDQRNRSDSGYQSGRQFATSRPRSDPPRGMELLWHPDVAFVYQQLLSDCSNPETLEAAAGAIQNLAACDWGPSAEIREAVRKHRGLPIIVELLTIEADRVVCAAATALRNLALDQRNKELIGKYAMRQLVMKLPSENRVPDFPVSDDTITAVQATLYEVIKKNADFAQSLLNEGGVDRLVHITQSRGKYSPKVVKFAASILYTMWQFRELHQEYRNKGWRQQHFVTGTMAARGGPSSSANNTLNRPRMDLGGGHPPSSATHSEPSSPGSNQRYGNSVPPGSYSEPTHTTDTGRHPNRDDRLRPEDIPMQQMGSAADLPSPGYAAIDYQRSRDRDDYRPPGGVPLFPNLMPGSQQPQPQVDSREPLYAQVNKQGKRRQDGMMLDTSQPEGGADSWV